VTATVHDRLRQAGIPLAVGRDRPEVAAECARLARLLRQGARRTVGLVPASDNVAVPAVALELGRALAETSGSPVGVVDAHGSWPGARSLAGAAPTGAALFAVSWLVETLALLTPRTFDTGGMLPKLIAAIQDEASDFGHLVVDLTGFDHLGEHLSAMAALDGIIVVARSGTTLWTQLERWMQQIPSGKDLGILLTGV
jgi:hypothetical protein